MKVLIKDENGQVIINPEIEQQLLEVEELESNISTQKAALKESILNAILEYQESTVSGKHYKYTAVVPKDKEVFDAEKFLIDENIEIVNAFTSISTSEEFSIEELKTRYPDIYKQCCITKTDATVNQKKLKSTLPNVYKKYCSIVESTSKPSLRTTKIGGV